MNTKLRCLLLDDELPGLTYLKMLCEQIPELEVIKSFNNPELFLNEISDLKFDLCILDIEMPGMSGLQIANILNGKPVIFTTAYKEYAAEAFDLNAIDYVRKPIRLERLKQAVEKAYKVIKTAPELPEKPFVQLNTDKGKTILYYDKIAYIETSPPDSRDKIARLFSNEEFVLKNISFDKLSEILPKKEFCRINKKVMISLKIIQAFSHDEITTTLISESGKNLKFSLGESYKNLFLQKVQI